MLSTPRSRQLAAALLLAVPLVASLVAPTPVRAQRNETLDVLFLGNSYIYFNNLPGLVEGISESIDGPDVRAFMHTHGGFSLERHLSDGHVPGLLAVAPADGGAWDHVVLQEQSQLGTSYADSTTGTLGEPVGFRDATRSIARMVRTNGSAPMLYMTWAKKRFPTQTHDLAAAYDGLGTELSIPVAPVGLAWARVVRERPDLELFVDDGSHPNEAGSYLAACVFYSMLTRRSPLGAPARIDGTPWAPNGQLSVGETGTLVSLSADVAEYLQRVAWETVRERVN